MCPLQDVLEVADIFITTTGNKDILMAAGACAVMPCCCAVLCCAPLGWLAGRVALDAARCAALSVSMCPPRLDADVEAPRPSTHPTPQPNTRHNQTWPR